MRAVSWLAAIGIAACNSPRVQSTTAPKGHRNQAAYDSAMHQLAQPRVTDLRVSLRRGEQPASDIRFTLDRRRFGDPAQAELPIHTTDASGAWRKERFTYGWSHIGLAVTGSDHAAYDNLVLDWHRPGRWFDEVAVSLALDAYRIEGWPSGSGHEFRIYHPSELTDIRASVSFGGLLLVVAKADDDDEDEDGREQYVQFEEAENMSELDVELEAFVKRYKDNFNPPLAVGRTLRLQVNVVANASSTSVDEVASSRTDPAFQPRRYSGLVDSVNGEPYLNVPTTEPATQISFRRAFDIELRERHFGMLPKGSYIGIYIEVPPAHDAFTHALYEVKPAERHPFDEEWKPSYDEEPRDAAGHRSLGTVTGWFDAMIVVAEKAPKLHVRVRFCTDKNKTCAAAGSRECRYVLEDAYTRKGTGRWVQELASSIGCRGRIERIPASAIGRCANGAKARYVRAEGGHGPCEE